MSEHLTSTELESLLEAARTAQRSQPAVETYIANGRFEQVANPTTIERLVLMVRELQQQYALCAQVQKRGEHSSWTCQCVVAVEEVLKRDVVEHFRARAVRALRAKSAALGIERDKYAQSEMAITYLSLHNQSLLARELAILIESLPLVETEEE